MHTLIVAHARPLPRTVIKAAMVTRIPLRSFFWGQRAPSAGSAQSEPCDDMTSRDLLAPFGEPSPSWSVELDAKLQVISSAAVWLQVC